jgi:hypothetical protein
LDNRIEWYEALILFLWYGAYVGFMKFNETAEDALRKLFRLPPSVSSFSKFHIDTGCDFGSESDSDSDSDYDNDSGYKSDSA